MNILLLYFYFGVLSNVNDLKIELYDVQIDREVTGRVRMKELSASFPFRCYRDEVTILREVVYEAG